MVDCEELPLRNDFGDDDPCLPIKCQQPESSPAASAVAGKTPPVKSKSQRVASLDVFRGLCVFLMMLVDYGGAIFPTIAHSPWNGIQLADVVMPFFLFVAGIALAIVYKKIPDSDRVDASWKALTRALHLFILGVFLQGGYLHGATSLTYGVDIESMRWMGILQRISIAYAVAALCEIWLPCRSSKRVGLFRSYTLQWSLVIVMSSIYLGLLYGLHVPDWEFRASDSVSSLNSSNDSYVYEVRCDVRGDLGPACNSAAMIDRYVLGISHLYAKPVYRNLEVCNKSSNGKVPENSPSWCHAPFDPEGLLGSLTAAVTCIIGLQFGHILVQLQEHKDRLQNWSILSVSCFILGLFLAFVGIPLNKSLYTVSYTLLTSGIAGITFCASYILVDVYGYRRVTSILEWMGVHSLSIFVLITSNIAIVVIQGFYFKDPSNNIIHWIISSFVQK